MRTTRGLLFNAPCECRSMHEGSKRLFLSSHFQQSVPLSIMNSTRGWALLGLLTLPAAGEREQEGKDTKQKRSKPLCTRLYVLISATKRGGWCVRAVVIVDPRCIAGWDRWPPMTTTPWPKAICFSLISTLIILQTSNPSLYSMFPLLHCTITMTRDKQCACCIRSKQDLYVFTLFFEIILIFLSSFFPIAPGRKCGIPTFIIHCVSRHFVIVT